MSAERDGLTDTSAGLESAAPRRRGVNLVEGSVGKHLLSLGVFLALGVCSNLITALADVYFVARLSAHALAALSFTFPIVLTISAIAMGLGNGVIAVVARAIGEGDHDGIRVLGTDSMLFGFLLVLTLSVAGYVSIDPLFKMLGADPEVMPLIRSYMEIWYLGTVVQIIPQVGQSIIRGHGDTRTVGLMMVVMCVTNTVFDPILIFGWGPIPAMGLKGAAWASIASRVVYGSGIMSMLHFKLHALAPVSFSVARIRESWKKLLHIGLPSTATQLVMPVSAAILTRVVATSGTLAVAAFGVATRIELLTAIYVWAVAGSLPAFVGQNAGAGRMDRVRHAISLATKFCMLSGLCTVIIAVVAAPQIVAQFTDNTDVITLAAYYLRVVSISYGPVALVMVTSQAMNALKRPLPASIVSLARTLGLTIPAALIGQWFWKIHGAFIGISLAYLGCGAMAWIMMEIVLRQETKSHEAPNVNGAVPVSGL